jgi:methylenetetrahydrofolate dehydrogenase (NADP+) / methenyltetrahydrofolate cyclohydrolase
MVRILDGAAIARGIEQDIAQATAGRDIRLAVVLVGDDPASHVYVRRKRQAATRAGIGSIEHRLPAETTQADLLALIAALNADRAIHGILVQLPLPPQIDSLRVLDAIAPEKDVDGFHPVNVGRLSRGGLVPCTPLGCMMLLDRVIDDFRGLKAVVIGKSNIVGKPMALLLLERECTVTVTHIYTRGLPEIVRGADIVVAAAGSPGLVRGDWIKPGAVVIDVGINRVGPRTIVGDVAAEECDHAGVLTPVPGGVGPMTIACLLSNTLAAAQSAARFRS